MITQEQVQSYVDKVYKAEQDFMVQSGLTVEAACTFKYTEGKKYFKVYMIYFNGQQSIHCFIDKNNGDLYKAETWYVAAKGVRGNIFQDKMPLLLRDFYKRL